MRHEISVPQWLLHLSNVNLNVFTSKLLWSRTRAGTGNWSTRSRLLHGLLGWLLPLKCSYNLFLVPWEFWLNWYHEYSICREYERDRLFNSSIVFPLVELVAQNVCLLRDVPVIHSEMCITHYYQKLLDIRCLWSRLLNTTLVNKKLNCIKLQLNELYQDKGYKQLKISLQKWWLIPQLLNTSSRPPWLSALVQENLDAKQPSRPRSHRVKSCSSLVYKGLVTDHDWVFPHKSALDEWTFHESR